MLSRKIIFVYIFIYFIYIYLAIFFPFLLSSTVMFFLHCMLNILRHEKIFCEIDESIASKHDPQMMWYFWVSIVNLFALLCSIFFSRKRYFLQFPCFLLTAELISLVSFLNILSISLYELKSSSLIVVELMMSFLEINFIVLKEFWYGKKYKRFFGEFIWILFFEYYCEG